MSGILKNYSNKLDKLDKKEKIGGKIRKLWEKSTKKLQKQKNSENDKNITIKSKITKKPKSKKLIKIRPKNIKNKTKNPKNTEKSKKPFNKPQKLANKRQNLDQITLRAVHKVKLLLRVSTKALRQISLSVAARLGLHSFRASSNWLNGFKKRTGVRLRGLSRAGPAKNGGVLSKSIVSAEVIDSEKVIESVVERVFRECSKEDGICPIGGNLDLIKKDFSAETKNLVGKKSENMEIYENSVKNMAKNRKNKAKYTKNMTKKRKNRAESVVKSEEIYSESYKKSKSKFILDKKSEINAKNGCKKLDSELNAMWARHFGRFEKRLAKECFHLCPSFLKAKMGVLREINV